MERCIECDAEITLSEDYEEGEIIECPDCGLEYIIKFDDNGKIVIVELNLEGEDWGE